MARVLGTALIVVLGWAAAGCEPSGGSPSQQRATMSDSALQVSLTTDKFHYASGEPIAITLTVANRAPPPITLGFTSGQRYDFAIEDAAGKTLWRWAADKGFIQVLGEETLEAGGKLVYQERFTERLGPGTYRIIGRLVASDRPLSAAVTVTVGG